MHRCRPWILACLLAACAAVPGGGAEASCCDEPQQPPPPRPLLARVRAAYRAPALILQDQDGRSVLLSELIEGSHPVALNFIFTTCTTICPVMTATFHELQDALAQDAAGLRMVTVTLDPEHDTPPVLARFAETYGASPAWRFLTGTSEQIDEVLRSFDGTVGNKMNHRPYTYFKVPGNPRWLRLDGLTGAAHLADELRGLLAETRR